jgi:Nod factor-specific ABC transporter NodJ protein
MIQIWAVYLRGLLIVKKRFLRTLLGMIISPLLYAIAFGWGIGNDLSVEGVPYLYFMLPGLIALGGMNQSFSIGTELNIARFYNRVFEEFLLAPSSAYRIVFGNVLYGVTKGVVSFCILMIIALITGTLGSCNPIIIVPVLLNCLMFASLGVLISLIVKSHRDMGTFSSFVIVPMSFLANTFFSLKKLPEFLIVLTKIIPLTHASITIRGAFLGAAVPVYHYGVLLGYIVCFFCLALFQVRRAVE